MEPDRLAENSQHTFSKSLPRSPHVEQKYPVMQNDLNAPGRNCSIEDNTQVPGYDNNCTANQNINVQRRRRARGNLRYTLSIIEKELEEAKRLIDRKLDPKIHGDNNATVRKPSKDISNILNEEPDLRSSQTLIKTPYVAQDEVPPRPCARPEKVYARYVQEGERNLMLIYEPKESKSQVYCKQIGNKNVMVHLNVSSNLCQLIDRENKGIIPLDSKGEVWLEIKRRSQLLSSSDMSAVTSVTDNVYGETCLYKYDRVGGLNEYVVSNNYVEGKIKSFKATEHSDINDVNCYHEDEDVPYDAISVKERGDSLVIKFEKWNNHGVLNADNIQESPILSYKKVIDFLRDKGNNFDVSICDWEYEERESVYSYISSNLQLVDMNEDYTEIPPAVQQFRYRATEPEEHSASSFGTSLDHRYDSPLVLGEELYSKVSKPTPKVFPRRDVVHNKKHDDPQVQHQQEQWTQRKEYRRSYSEPTVVPSKDNGKQYDHRAQNKEQRKDEPSHSPKHSLKQDLTEHTWYHGKIKKDLAKERLKGKEHGSFLVRDAANDGKTGHKYTIEFIDGTTTKKLMIMCTNSKYHLKDYENKKFDRVEQLISTIISNGLEVKDSRSDQWKNVKVKPVS